MSQYATETKSKEGKDLFWEHCAKCHKIGKELTGPDLTNINDKRTQQWLINFIQNSQKVIESGDPIALEVYASYEEVLMPEVDLSENDVIKILNYISETSLLTHIPKDTVTPAKEEITSKHIPISFVFFILFILIIISILLVRKKIKVSEKGILYFLFYQISRTFHFTFGTIILTVLLIQLNKDIQYYKELSYLDNLTQPIEFSHKVHFEDYDIDCIYCHVKATNNDKANLPGINNCIKCHEYIEEGELYEKQEIDKIYKLIETGKAIIWETGYRLKAHSHFSHHIHSKTAKLNCVDCHQNTENPIITSKTFNMKWCIDCHSTSNIDPANKYYISQFSDSIQKTNIKLSSFGGLDCNICHY